MMTRWIRKPAMLGLGLGATLVAAIVGCGGQATDSSDAVVVPDGTVVNSAPAPNAGGTAPAAGAPATAAPTAAAGTTPVKAEGFGTLKGQIVFGGAPPAPKLIADKGKAAKDPEVCAKNAPLVSERLVVDGATKGVKNALVYLPRPTGVSDEARKAYSTAKIVFDQENCVFQPHVLGMMAGTPISLKSSDPINHNINAKLKQSAFNQLLQGGSTTQFTAQG